MKKERYVWIVSFFTFLIIYPLSAGSGIPHPDPKNDSLIPISGWPFYLENLEIGTPVSDYGSHFGIKASVDNDGEYYPRFDDPNRVDVKHFLNMAHYVAITSFYGQVDQSYFWFRETSPGSAEHLKPAISRSIQFYPYGWSESASDSSLSASAWVTTIDTDTFLISISVKNLTSGPITLTPVLTIFKDSDPQREGTNVPGSSFGDCFQANNYSNIGTLLCNGQRDSKNIIFARAIYPSEPIININQTTGPNYNFDIEFSSIILGPNETKEFYLTLSYAAEGDAENQAGVLALMGSTKVADAGGADGLINSISAEWNEFFNKLPVPHTTDQKQIQLYKMSATALRMNIYRKRNKMPADCSVPGKGHFNFFWAWDTPFHTLGQSEWSTKLAKDNLTTQFAGQTEEGKIRMVIDDNLTSKFWPDLTQPPVQGWAIKEIAERDGFKDTEWLRAMYEASKKYLEFWETTRDSDGDGLYEFVSGLETGWDDTPRFHCGFYTNICIVPTDKIDSLDLNSWLYLYYTSMKEIAQFLGYDIEAEDFARKAEALANNIDQKLWDEESGAFYDRELIGENEHDSIRVLTPATFFPLFVGAVRDVNKAKRVIEEHLLNPDEFWGKYPIPTVADNDPKYDHSDDGYYWQGQIWLMTAYAAIKALYRYGYEDEAEELKKRLLEMMFNADPGGIHETYDALTGKIGWGAGSNGYFGGVREPSVFQFGWSSAFTMEIILDRYQSERFLMPDDIAIKGFVREIREIESGNLFLQVSPDINELPYITLSSGTELTISESKSFNLTLGDPYNNYEAGESIRINLGFDAKIGAVSNDGSIAWSPVQKDNKGYYFMATITGEESGIKYYIILREEEGCGCNTSTGSQFPIFIFLFFLLAILFLKRTAGT